MALRSRPDSRSLPIVIVSVLDVEREDVADAHVRKPIDVDLLQSVVSDLLAGPVGDLPELIIADTSESALDAVARVLNHAGYEETSGGELSLADLADDPPTLLISNRALDSGGQLARCAEFVRGDDRVVVLVFAREVVDQSG